MDCWPERFNIRRLYLSRVGAEITSNTGGVNIFANIELDNDQETPLRPGAFVRLRMPDKTYKSVISILKQQFTKMNTFI